MWFKKNQATPPPSQQIALLQAMLQTAFHEKERLSAILESMAEGVMVIGADQRVILVNSVLCEALELKNENIAGHDYWEIFRDPEINTMIGRAFELRKPFSKEHRILLSELDFQVQISPVNRGGEFLGVIAVFHDITQLKKLERMRTEFAANVSHELKTPLTSIMGFVETLKEGAIEDPENRLKFLGIIEDHAKKLHRLIENLLFLSKLESAEIPLQKERTDLSEITLDVLKTHALLIKQRKIHVETVPSGSFFAEVDPYLVEQALSNVVGNAIKYNQEGGSVKIEFLHEDGGTLVRVSDTGIGISKEDLPHIFERFYRAEKSRSRQTGGTGLGLSIAKHVTERHGGQIRVESVENRGSVFTLSLP